MERIIGDNNEQHIAYLEHENHYLNNVVIKDLEDKLSDSLNKLYYLVSTINKTNSIIDRNLSNLIEDSLVFYNHNRHYNKIIKEPDYKDLPF